MVKAHLRTSKVVRKKRRLPSGKVGVIFRKKKARKARCPDTGQVLHGTAYGRKRDVRSMSKSEKRPTRYYGGILSAQALKNRLVDKVYSLIHKE